MKITLRGVSGAALLFGLASIQPALAQRAAPPAQPKDQTVRTSQPTVAPADLSGPQVAQTGPQAAPQADASKTEKVIVTGSLIATTPEDAPKPVEVYTNEDLKAQGNPSVSDFVRSLTVSAGSSLGFGQANPQVPTGTGFSSADLRGLGPNATMTMLNGHNMNPANGGYGADLNTIPTAALEAVEVLKDGASSTYGAGAVGGVLNFRTRRDINAPQLSVQKSFYKDGDGNLRVDFLDGWKGDAGNLLVNYTYEHEGRMGADKRDFSSLPFRVNPSEWSLTAGNPGGFNIQTTPFLTGTGTQALTGILEDLRGTALLPGATALSFGAITAGSQAAADCNAIGGEIAQLARPGSLNINQIGLNNGCIYSQAPYEDLISDTTRHQGYVEFNANLSDNMEVHFSASYSKDSRVQEVTPAYAAANRATDGTINGTLGQCALSATTQTGCGYVIPYQVNNYTVAGAATATATVNPFIQDFMTRTGLTSATLPNTGALYTAADWRPWFAGGNPLFGDGLTHNTVTREQMLISSGISGNFSDDGFLGKLGLGKLLSGINYDFNAQYLQYQQTDTLPDVFISRLQNALLGYGGPGCNAVDRVPTDFSSAAAFNRTIGIQSDTAPGTNGCQWLNPFASSFPTSVMNGAANPQFNSGAAAGGRPYTNSKQLADWLTGNKETEDLYQTSTFNYTLTGELPKGISLPGGKIGWAAGTEWRLVQRQDSTFDSSSAEVRLNTQKCPFPDSTVIESNTANNAPNPNQTGQQPGSRGCLTGSGAFNGTGFVVANTGETIPNYHDTQELAFFGELSLPVTDKLNMDLSVRREDYNGGAIGATIYNVSGKYAITDNFYVRGSYGTNFRADTALDLQPGQLTQSNPSQGRFGGIVIPTFTTVAQDLKPENDITQNYGIGYKNNDVFGGRLRASLDWSQTQINGFVTTASTTQVLANVFGRNDVSGIAPNPAVGIGGSQNNRGAGIPNTATTNSSGQFADCGASLVQYIVFNGTCVTGTTTAANIVSLIQSRLNGPSFVTNGLDYVFDYSHPLFDGDIGLNLTATETLVYKADSFMVNGTLFAAASNNLGYVNWTHQGAGGTNAGAGVGNSRWKANASLRWANTEHNINLRATYDSGRYDERFDPGAVQSLPLTALVNNTTIWSTYGIERKNFLSFDLNYIYTPNWMKGLELQASILDLLDRNPPLAQFQLGYQSGIGDPRKRTFVLKAGYKF